MRVVGIIFVALLGLLLIGLWSHLDGENQEMLFIGALISVLGLMMVLSDSNGTYTLVSLGLCAIGGWMIISAASTGLDAWKLSSEHRVEAGRSNTTKSQTATGK